MRLTQIHGAQKRISTQISHSDHRNWLKSESENAIHVRMALCLRLYQGLHDKTLFLKRKARL